ncbi:hypothetical protein CC80DRAFT_547563 [Byssothecium circinans]|uniref:F-box domain-containing protein n=1 Tax=Byssothecium circinans TaxID=147558 RepID=A0A6A5U139_9PLEO|nr:hypothetical protein CC80DRAFT_547563 [Byssothecium circinans]
MAGISSLPDELILNVLSNFETVRSDEPQAQAFQEKDHERNRQRENRASQLALHTLCLVSRRLNGLGTPFLYASFFGSATNYGLGPVQAFHRTISERSDLAKHVEYVENRLSDYLGNDLLHTILHEAENIVPEYFRLLGTIICLSPNLQQLCVISLENSEITLWNHIFGAGREVQLPSHGFPKLKKVAFQTNAKDEYVSIHDGRSFSRICSGLALMPSLLSLEVSGAVCGCSRDFATPFANLQRVSLNDTMASTDEVAMLLLACNRLTHFACEWVNRYYISGGVPSILEMGLRKHQHSLETLSLTARGHFVDGVHVDHTGNLDFPIKYQEFTALTEVTLPRLLLPAKPFMLPYLDTEPLAKFLPASLESLIIENFCLDSTSSFELLAALWTLTRDCPQLLPRLRQVAVRVRDTDYAMILETTFGDTERQLGGVTRLNEKFEELGVQFQLVVEFGFFNVVRIDAALV